MKGVYILRYIPATSSRRYRRSFLLELL